MKLEGVNVGDVLLVTSDVTVDIGLTVCIVDVGRREQLWVVPSCRRAKCRMSVYEGRLSVHERRTSPFNVPSDMPRGPHSVNQACDNVHLA